MSGKFVVSAAVHRCTTCSTRIGVLSSTLRGRCPIADSDRSPGFALPMPTQTLDSSTLRSERVDERLVRCAILLPRADRQA